MTKSELKCLVHVMRMEVVVIQLLFIVAAFSPARSDIPEHLIKSLPGWEGPLPTTQYSGYIEVNATTGKYLHYWFVESANDPKTDPVVLWLNGGPGCSSLDGYINEQGPLHFDRSTADKLPIPNLEFNPYTWTNITNMIFLESPAGVGFSYSDNPTVDYHIDDNQTALDNYHFLVQWFRSYSEYRNNDFYISGESYAGIYVPTLVNTIRIMNEQTTTDKLNLKGFMVGNGCVGNQVGTCGSVTGIKIHVDYFNGHALFPASLYEEIEKACGNYSDMSAACIALLEEMSKDIGPVNIYDIYAPCYNNLPSSNTRARNPLKELIVGKTKHKYYGPDECIDDHVESKYFNNSEVRMAIHVASIEKIGGWRICTSPKKLHYNSDTKSLLSLYPTLIKTYRTLIYNGDVDGGIPFSGDEQWTSGLGFGIKEGWRPWMVDDQVAGYVTEYDVNGFKFVTVKGSGHMVPQYRPKQAFAMFERFIENKPF